MSEPSRNRGLGVAAGLDPDVAHTLGAACAAGGYSSLWSNDHPLASGLETAGEFTVAAPGLDIGVAVLPLDRHEPADIATKIGELGIDPARLWIGIGAGFTKRPLGVVHDGLEAMRSALPAGTRIAVAAMGPRMCRLAGAEADGVFLNWMTPERAVWARERIDEGIADSGRDSPPVVFGYVRVAVGPGATERLHKEESFYRKLHDGYIRHFRSLDSEPGTVGIATSQAEDVPEQLERYEPAIDHLVVRALAHADANSLGAVAGAAAPSASTRAGKGH